MSANEALKLLKAGKVEQAQTLCLNLLRANPRDINAHHLLASPLCQPAGTVRSFEEALRRIATP
jgi:hypothetical protein